MTDNEANIVLEQLRLIRTDMAEMRAEINTVHQKVDGISQTLLTVKRDIRTVQQELIVLGSAGDEHTRRLDRIEKKLGLELVEA